MNFNAYKNIPLVKYTIASIAGVYLGGFLHSRYLLYFFLLIGFISLTFYLYSKHESTLRKVKIKHNTFSVLFLIIFVGLGYFTRFYHIEKQYLSYFGNYLNSTQQKIKLRIASDLIEKDNSYKLTAELVQIKNDQNIINVSGKLLLYVQKDSLSSLLKENDFLFIHTEIQKIEKPKNPNEFDYNQYLSYKNIHFQAYVNQKNWSLHQACRNKMSNLLDDIKNYLQSSIHKNIDGQNERAVASALLLGNKTYLSNNTRNIFSNTGATHILAVSGLHVGLFYYILYTILGLLPKFKGVKKIQTTISILLLWFYVLLTGASPSVVRAATMFSLIAIGLNMNRYINLYNIIASSALIMVLYNPLIIYDLGFQLSYLALIGIVFLQQKIYRQLIFKNKIINKIWEICSVSLAAQLATFPIILYYFHKFPNFFFISNLLVIPSAIIILYGGILMFLFSWNALISKSIGLLLTAVIKIMNFTLAFLEKIPYAVSENIHINVVQVILLYSIVFIGIFCLQTRNKRYLFALIILLFLKISIYHYHEYEDSNHSKFIVYHIPRRSAIDFIINSNAYHLIDSSLLAEKKELNFRIKPNWSKNRIKNHHFDFKQLNHQKFKKLDLFLVKNSKIGKLSNYDPSEFYNLDLDYLIISNSKNLDLLKLSKQIRAKKYIFDCSNKKYQENIWNKECAELNLNCYFVSSNSAFEIDL